MHRKFTDEHIAFIKRNYLGVSSIKLTRLINKQFDTDFKVTQIESLRYRLNLKSGLDFGFKKGQHPSPATEFKKGNVSWNKGRKGVCYSPETMFKLGNKPHNTAPIGTVLMRSDGYIYKKIADVKPSRKGWKQLHRIIWEEKHGKVPEGMRIVFIDQDKTNTTIENLALASKGDLAQMNKKKLFSDDPLRNQAYLNITKIKLKISRLESNS